MNFFQIVANRPIVIFGASILGEVILRLLEIYNLKPVCFGDNDIKKQTSLFHNYKVIGIEELRRRHPNAAIVIGAGRYYKEIFQQLNQHGYQTIYNDTDIIDSINWSAVPFEKVENILWRLAQLGKLSLLKIIPPGALHLKRLNVVVTDRCTLKCSNCSSLIPYYQSPRDCNLEILITSIQAILQAVDYIYHMEVLGGEPFIYNNLQEVLQQLAKYKTILQIDIITNGTLIPSKEVIHALKCNNMCVVVNDYGKISVKKDEVLSILTEAGVNCRINRHWAWADLGNFEKRGRNENELSNLFYQCNFGTCSELLRGCLYRCPRSSHGMNLGLIPGDERDYVNVLGLASDLIELRKHLQALIHERKSITACDYCDGNTEKSLILSPAIQLKGTE